MKAEDSLTPERFARLRSLYEAALERSPSERRAYLEAACAGDRDLLAEVEGMLVADDTALLYAPAPSSAPDEGRFPAGTVLAGRYRILGLLGKGGMGEVYKAFDLILNQTVALKFLTYTGIGEAALARFRNEVRIARQVSHPNVCRVYDVGLTEGLHFLSMEYIDGEDLNSLLRRIGRLPQDKAVELTRKICAGLGAAHERGVLHRDLKPGNIMVDGRGQPRIADFGLAALAQEIPLSDLRSGTPAYMSPEQKAGKEVTARSDIYSLGLVLHEMFTGKARQDTQSSPSELVKDLDPTIERLILRCIEEDPKRRPATALSVAMALPGGDPIAAALAAGETPSPEMVAASQEKEGMSPRVAWACFGAVLALLAVAVAIHGKFDLQSRAPLDIPPDALAFRAQTILHRLGYQQKPVDTAYGINCCDMDFLMSMANWDPARRDAVLATHQPAVIRFWYRQHNGLFYADSFLAQSSVPPTSPLTGVVTYASPPNTEPGMIRMQLSPKGDLVALEARPPADETAGSPVASIDWNPVLAAAGLDPSRLLSVAPLRVPSTAFDARAAWIGTYAPGRSERVRVEGAAWRGKPVFFDLRGDWQMGSDLSTNASPVGVSILFAVAIVLLTAGVLLARRNVNQGRGNRRGATWLALTMFGAVFLRWIPMTHHVPANWEMGSLVKAICEALFLAVAGVVLYLAIEPIARRFWPDAFISLTRLQVGRYRDPLVASHILVGLTASAGYMVFDLCATRLLEGRNTIFLPRIDTLVSPGYAAGMLLFDIAPSLVTALLALLLLVLMRQITRRTWLAYLLSAVFMAIVVLPFGSIYPTPAMRAERLVAAGTPFVLLGGWGLLAFISWQFGIWLSSFPLAPAGWYAGQTFLLLAIPAALAAWALWVILTAQRSLSTD